MNPYMIQFILCTVGNIAIGVVLTLFVQMLFSVRKIRNDLLAITRELERDRVLRSKKK